MEDAGLITIATAHPVAETVAKLEAVLTAKGVTQFARIDHAAGAAGVGLALRPTVVVIFGDPRAGTPLMQADQRAGLDLPLKLLAWEDEHGRACVTYSDPRWIARRYGLRGEAAAAAAHLAGVLDALAASIAA